MSGTQVSAWQTPNELLTSMETPALVQRNQLMNQEAQQTINSNEMEQASRAANWVLTQDDKPAAYSTALRLLKANGYAKNSPDQYPGDAAISYLARQGTPSAEQFKLGQAGTAIPTPGFTTGTTAPSSGGGVSTAGTSLPSYGGAVNAPPMPAEYEQHFQDASKATGVPVELLKAVATQESGFNPGAAHGGIMQITAGTATNPGYGMEGVRNPAELADPRSNIMFGAQYLAARAKAIGADLNTPEGRAAALKAYNGGGDPNYVANVFRYIPGGGTQVASTTPSAAPGGGVAARTGGTNVAGPPGVVPPPAASAAAPPAYATAPTKEAATAQAIATGKPVLIEGGQGAAALPSGRLVANLPDLPTAPPTQPTAAPPPPAVAPVAIPAPPAMDNNNLTRQDYQDLDRARRAGMTGPQLTQEVQQRQVANLARQERYRGDVRQAQNDAQTQQERAIADARAAEQLRLSQKSDARAEAEAKRAGLPTGYRLDENGKAVRIDGLPPDPAVLEAQANAGKQAQRQFEQENTLRDEFQKLTGDFRIVQTSYENIRSAAKANDGAGDMSLLYNYVRLLDPTSVVRESEFAAAAASGNLGERVQTAYERIATGARMPESLRQSFIREGKNLYDNQLRSHNTVADQYEELARANGLEPKRVVTRFARPQDDAAPATPPPPPGFKVVQ